MCSTSRYIQFSIALNRAQTMVSQRLSNEQCSCQNEHIRTMRTFGANSIYGSTGLQLGWSLFRTEACFTVLGPQHPVLRRCESQQPVTRLDFVRDIAKFLCVLLVNSVSHMGSRTWTSWCTSKHRSETQTPVVPQSNAKLPLYPIGCCISLTRGPHRKSFQTQS